MDYESVIDLDNVRDGDIIVVPDTRRVRVGMSTMRKWGLSVGDTCRASNRWTTVSEMLRPGSGVKHLLLTNVGTKDVTPEYEEIASNDLTAIAAPRKMLVSVKLADLSSDVAGTVHAFKDAFRERIRWMGLEDFFATNSRQYRNTQDWALRMAIDHENSIDGTYENETLVPAPNCTFQGSVQPCDVPDEALSDLFYGYTRKFIYAPRLFMSQLVRYGCRIIRPDAEIVDAIVRQILSRRLAAAAARLNHVSSIASETHAELGRQLEANSRRIGRFTAKSEEYRLPDDQRETLSLVFKCLGTEVL